MRNLDFRSQVLPHLIAVGVFFFLTIIYYSPVFFDNEMLQQHDVVQGIASGQEAREYRQKTGEEALWTNSMFGGMPSYVIDIRWNGNLIRFVEKLYTAGLTSAPGVTYTCFLSFYILLLVFGVRPYIAIIGALAFGLNTFNIIGISAGHIWKIRAVAYMPLVLAGIHEVIKSNGKKLIGTSLFALGLALEIKANHLQITYYLLLLIAFYGISYLIYTVKEKGYSDLVKNGSLLIVGAILAVGSNLGQLWSTYEYGKFSTRGPSEITTTSVNKEGLDKDYVFRWSSGKFESSTLLIPNIYGGASAESLLANKGSKTLNALRRSNDPNAQQLARYASGYWGDQPGTAPYYAGAIVCFLFILGAILAEGKIKYWIIAGTIFSLMLSWGHNFTVFNDLMFYHFPMYNKFRAVTMSLAIAMLLLPLLGFIGLEQIISSKWNKALAKKLAYAVGASAGIALIFMLAPSILSLQSSMESQLPNWLTNAMRADRASIVRADSFRTMVFILLFAGVIWLWVTEKLKSTYSIIILAVLLLTDMWTVDKRYLNQDNFVRKVRNHGIAASAADKQILKDKELNYRVLNLLNPWNEAKTSYFHASIGGYHGAKVKRYQQLIDRCLDNQKNQVISKLQGGTIDFSDLGMLNALNAKYIKFGDDAKQVITNSSANGNAWFASNIETVNSPDEEIEKVSSLRDSKKAIVNTSKFSSELTKGQGSIKLTSYSPKKLVYEANVSTGGLAVFSEIYYPKGWIATIDGVETEIIQSNFVLRALNIPPGQHQIEFSFEPKAFTLGSSIMLFFSLSIILSIPVAILLEMKKEKNA